MLAHSEDLEEVAPRITADSYPLCPPHPIPLPILVSVLFHQTTLLLTFQANVFQLLFEDLHLSFARPATCKQFLVIPVHAAFPDVALQALDGRVLLALLSQGEEEQRED